jgi:hypothetical protein
MVANADGQEWAEKEKETGLCRSEIQPFSTPVAVKIFFGDTVKYCRQRP